MNVSDETLIVGRLVSWEKGRAYGKDARHITGNIVTDNLLFSRMTLVGKQEEANNAKGANKDISHSSVIVVAHGAWQSCLENDHGAKNEYERKKDS